MPCHVSLGDQNMKRIIRSALLILLFCLRISRFACGQAETVGCPHPAVPLYASVTLSSQQLGPGTTATYDCDEGYELFGESTRTCLSGGKWSGEIPHCATNVAYGKPANQSSTVSRGGEPWRANDGDVGAIEGKGCSETRAESSPWWQVDLLAPYPVLVVRISTRGCCGHQPLQDLEIRVGNSSTVQGNRLCAWYPRPLEDGITKDFTCAYPIIGRYVYIQIVGTHGSLSLCEVMVFTTHEISSGRCVNQLEPLELTTFRRTCYEFQTRKGGSFEEAKDYCHARGGLLLKTAESDLSQGFVASELERRKEQLKSKLVWLGAQRDTGLRAKTWHWVDGEPVQRYLWAEDQPNNYNGQQNCVVLDGGRRWLWNDVTCDLDYLPWVCQYNPSTCGSPDRLENSTVLEKDFRLGQSITYKCPEGSKVVGDEMRKCDTNGFWTGSAPSCQHVNCGELQDIPFGRVSFPEGRTTYNATARYECDTNYTLVGGATRRCAEDGKWNGTELPKCLYHWCSILKPPINGSLDLSGVKASDEARFTCNRGHFLEGGPPLLVCQLGGQWTGEQPICRYIDCGRPALVGNGTYQLIDERASTTYLSRVVYRCLDNYTLEGNAERTCLETGKWSGRRPVCNLINCGRPEAPLGTELASDSSFTVHSEVRYRCKAGHKMVTGTGKDQEMTRKCLPNGKWSGEPPTCKYVDCGRLQPPLRGEIRYPKGQGPTHLGSVATYACTPGFRLIGGDEKRKCEVDGKWTGQAPKCEEVRCVPPEVLKNATVTYGGNDRASADSFRVGATAQYKCAPGHLIRGEPLRTCLPDGRWSHGTPSCQYVDCGLPKRLSHGHWMLPSNATFYGSQAVYVCDQDFEIRGPGRRLCLENATWSGEEPSCRVVSCGKPEKKDDKTMVSGDNFEVGGSVTYSCVPGYTLVGNVTRYCCGDGQWSGEVPYCTLVDCGTPSAIANGQGFLVNGTTTFGSLVQFRCLPEFQMVGEPERVCLDSGEWSGLQPKCVDAVLEADNAADERFAENQDVDASKTIGIAIAVGAGALLIIIIIVAVICMKTRRAKVLDGTCPRRSRRVEESSDSTTLRAYPSRLALETEAPQPTVQDRSTNGVGLNGTGPIRHHPNGLVTFGNQSQPIYANVTDGDARTTPHRQLKNGVLQSESL